MGCVSSNLLHHDDEFTQLGSSALSHHIVSLTSTTYGLLNLDPSPTTPPPRFTFGSIFPSPLSDIRSEPKSLWSEPKSLRSEPDIINSWELMAGLDTDSFRFSPMPQPKPFPPKRSIVDSKDNSNPNFTSTNKSSLKYSLDMFEALCPPNGENGVILYTTTLRGVLRTFEACNAARAAMESLGVSICERDVSMDRGFREELRELMKGKEREALVPPRVFVKGRYIGGCEEVMRIVEEGWLSFLVQGLPKKKAGSICEGCGGARFLPCFQCNGSCKIVIVVKENLGEKQAKNVVVKCPDCNENGLVLCPICS